MSHTHCPFVAYSRVHAAAKSLVVVTAALILGATSACQSSNDAGPPPKKAVAPDPGSLPVSETGEISFYADSLAGNPTANGETYTLTAASCAHRKLKFGTWLHITDVATKKTATCRVNDRGPYAKGRILDVSRAVAKTLAFEKKGHIQTELRILPGPPAASTAAP